MKFKKLEKCSLNIVRTVPIKLLSNKKTALMSALLFESYHAIDAHPNTHTNASKL